MGGRVGGMVVDHTDPHRACDIHGCVAGVVAVLEQLLDGMGCGRKGAGCGGEFCAPHGLRRPPLSPGRAMAPEVFARNRVCLIRQRGWGSAVGFE